MQYTTKKYEPAVAPKDKVVHIMGEMPMTGDAQQKGTDTDTGPKGAEMFPSTDEWKGKPVTGDYQTIPEDKDAIEQNLRTAGEEVRTRFGLETRGIDVPQENEPDKPATDEAMMPSGK